MAELINVKQCLDTKGFVFLLASSGLNVSVESFNDYCKLLESTESLYFDTMVWCIDKPLNEHVEKLL